jgi:RNA polymerase sigma factor (sigma-70 family)
VSEAAAPAGMRGRVGAANLLSDDRLARRAVEGDERAFAAIFRRYHQDLYRFCLAIVGNPQDAQDALQNSMVKVLGALPGERRRIELKPWLYRIAHNESVELLRRRRPTEQLDPDLATRSSGLAEEAELRERLRRLIVDLDQLPERQRGTLVMRELAGLDFAEIAAALGTSPAVARQTLYEARLSLGRMEEGREMSCDSVTRALSDADGRVSRRRDIRAHLRACPDCRRFREQIGGRRSDFASLSPLPAVAAAGLLQGLLGVGGGGGAGLAGALGGGAAKSLGAAAAIKSAAAVAVVAAVGVGAAEQGGLVSIDPLDGGGSGQAQSDRPVAPAATRFPQSPAGSGAAEGRNHSAAVRRGSALDAGGRPAATNGGAAGQGRASAPGADMPAAAGDQGAAASHPRGRDHEKRHPSAAAHGQQTAASHKAGGKDAGGGRSSHSHPGQPPKPAKPAHPVRPAAAGGSKGATSPKAPAKPGSTPPPIQAPRSTEPKGPHSLPESGKQP